MSRQIDIYQRNDVLLRVKVNDLEGIEKAVFKMSNGVECILEKNVTIEDDFVMINLTADETNIKSGFYKFELTVYDVESKEYTVLQTTLRILGRDCINV